MTMDYIEDAVDALEKSKAKYLIVAAFEGETKCYIAGRAADEEQIHWLSDKVSKLLTRMYEQCDE